MRTDRHGLDVVDRYQRRKYRVQQRERALAGRFLALATLVFIVLILTAYGVVR